MGVAGLCLQTGLGSVGRPSDQRPSGASRRAPRPSFLSSLRAFHPGGYAQERRFGGGEAGVRGTRPPLPPLPKGGRIGGAICDGGRGGCSRPYFEKNFGSRRRKIMTGTREASRAMVEGSGTGVAVGIVLIPTRME